MIRAKSISGKLNLINISDQQLFDCCIADFNPSMHICPNCGAIGWFSHAASYERTMITVIRGKRQEISVAVPRLKCESCSHTHAILPDCLIPFGSYSVRFVLQILLTYLNRNCTVAALCDKWQISISTLYGWIHLFTLQYSLWFGILKQIHWISMMALSQIQDTSDFLNLFYNKYQFSFLQFQTTLSNPPPSKAFSSG